MTNSENGEITYLTIDEVKKLCEHEGVDAKYFLQDVDVTEPIPAKRLAYWLGY